MFLLVILYLTNIGQDGAKLRNYTPNTLFISAPLLGSNLQYDTKIRSLLLT